MGTGNSLKIVFLSALAALSLALGTPALHAQTMRIGLTDPLDTPHGQAMVLFKEIMEKQSTGRVSVKLFPSLQLGQIVEQIEGVKQGSQEMMMATPAWFSRFYPAADVFSLPYLVTDWEGGERMLRSQIAAKVAAEAERATGIKIAGWLPVGFRNVINKKRPVNRLADLSGLKIRLQNSPVQIATFQALGANPVALAWGETYQAVQTGVVDGLENSLPILVSNKFSEIAPFVSLTQHFFEFFLVFVNPKFYASLSAEDKKIFDNAMLQAQARCLELVKKAEESAVADLQKQGAKANNVTPAELKSFQAAVKPVYEEFGKKFEPTLTELRNAIGGK